MRKWAVPIVVALTLLFGALTVMNTGSPYSGAAEALPETRHYDYGGHPGQDLDLYLPASVAAARAGTVLRPTVVLVHGGAWTSGDKTDMTRHAEQLIDLGYVAASVNYRLAPEAPWPAQRRDLVAALKWIHARAGDLHVDASRIVVLGSSAGGEIAAAALTEGDGSKLARGLIALSGPFDFALVAEDTTGTRNAASLAESVGADLLHCLPADCPAAYEQDSVFPKIDRRDPPDLLFASQDEWVDPQSSIRYHQVALAHGIDSRLVMFPGDQHGGSYWDEALPIITQWLAQRMLAPR